MVLGRESVPEGGKVEAHIWKGFGHTKYFLREQKVMMVDGNKLEFLWSGNTYTIDLSYCSKFNKDRVPILDYEMGHSIPIRLAIKPDELPDKDSSKVFNEIFNLGILKAIIASATKLKADNPTLITILAGFGLGMMATLILAHFGVFGNLFSSTPSGSGTVTGGH